MHELVEVDGVLARHDILEGRACLASLVRRDRRPGETGKVSPWGLYGRTFFVEVFEGACSEGACEYDVQNDEQDGAPFLEGVGVGERAVDSA